MVQASGSESHICEKLLLLRPHAFAQNDRIRTGGGVRERAMLYGRPPV